MDKITLVDNDVAICEAYAKANLEQFNEFMIGDDFPFTDIEIEFKEMQMNFKIYKKPTYTNLYVLVDNKKCGWFRFKNGSLEIIKTKLIKKLKEEHYNAYMGIYYSIMFYIATYRPILEPKEIREGKKLHKRSNKKSSNITYIFNRHYITNPNNKHTKHKPCEYAFKVRGHYRHLKNGKKIWVKEYTKGKGKLKERKYRL